MKRIRAERWEPPSELPGQGFLFSVVLHSCFVFCLLGVNHYFQDEPRYGRLEMTPLPPEPASNKIIWYPTTVALPDIAATEVFGPGKTPQGDRSLAQQTLIAHSPQPKSTKQLIIEPDHPEPLPEDVPTPNRVAVAARPVPPAKAPPKEFVPPPDTKPRPEARPVSSALPVVSAATVPNGENNVLNQLIQQTVAKPAPKLFVPPSQKGGPSGPAQLPEAPAIQSPTGSQPGGATGSALQAIVAGLNPAPGPLPEGSRSAAFARAPVIGTPSSGSARSGTPAVPGLVARNANGKPAEAPPAAAAAAKPPERFLVKETPYVAFNRTLSVPLRPSSRVIPATVEAQFANRNVYTLLIPKPDLPEYTDDWVLWFSERHPGEQQAPRISAPVPARKYSLIGGASTANGPASGTLQFAVVVDRSGRISLPRILRGTAGEAFRVRAMEELLNWEFQPASRNGEPIDVDVVLEIAFHFPGAAADLRTAH